STDHFQLFQQSKFSTECRNTTFTVIIRFFSAHIKHLLTEKCISLRTTHSQYICAKCPNFPIVKSSVLTGREHTKVEN
uniref:Ovule protein n=1 Tax=Parascaris equorum TaxID=6256 RepID=A0A914RVG4_PAREQ